MNFSENELRGRNRTSSFLAYGEAGKCALGVPANYSENFEVLFSNDGSDLQSTVLRVDQPLRNKPLETACGRSEKL